MSSNNATTYNNIPPKILRQNVKAAANTLQLVLVMIYQTVNFPEILPAFCLQFQTLKINKHLKNHLSPYLFGYRKGFSSYKTSNFKKNS